MGSYFPATKEIWDPEDKVNWALQGLHGEAGRWSEIYLDAWPDAVQKDSSGNWIVSIPSGDPREPIYDVCRSWDKYKEAFKRQWCTLDRAVQADKELDELHYGGDIASFTAKFKSLASHTVDNEKTLRNRYVKALPLKLRLLVKNDVDYKQRTYSEITNRAIVLGQQQESEKNLSGTTPSKSLYSGTQG